MDRQKAPRTNRSRKTLPAAFTSRGDQRWRSPTPHGERDGGAGASAAASGPNATAAAADVGQYAAAGSDGAAGAGAAGAAGAGVGDPGPVLLPPPVLSSVAVGAGSARGREAIRPDSLVFLSSCPQRHGHAVLKKMLHPPTLGLFCLVELPGADHQRAPLRASLQDWLRRWCTLQVERPDLLVAVCETFWDAPQGYPMGILCEYMPLGSLDELLQACGGLPEEAMREIAQAVLEALHALHSVQPPVVHGCLKPSQVLFSADGRPRLAFGLEQRLKGSQARSLQTARGSVAEDVGRDAGGGVAAQEAEGLGAAVAAPAGAPSACAEQQSTAVDIFDLGLLLLVSALGGMDVLLEAIPYAREFGSRSGRGHSAPLSAVFHDTCALLQQELRAPAAAAGAEQGGGTSDMGYLPPASDLLFNRQYSESFLAFVSTCLEAHTREAPVSARDLLRHEFLQLTSPLGGPLVSLREMQELARLVNEAQEHDPSRFGPGKVLKSNVPGVAPSVAHSAQIYLANIAQSVAPYFGPRVGGAVAPGHGAAVAASGPPRRRQAEWETLLVDSARTYGLPKAVVQAALEAQLDALLAPGGAVAAAADAAACAAPGVAPLHVAERRTIAEWSA